MNAITCFIKHTWATRTKGTMVCTGIGLKTEGGVINLSPLDSDGVATKPIIGLPKSQAVDVAVAILKAAGAMIEVELRDGVPCLATPGAWDCVRMRKISTDTEGYDPAEYTHLLGADGNVQDVIVEEIELRTTIYEEL